MRKNHQVVPGMFIGKVPHWGNVIFGSANFLIAFIAISFIANADMAENVRQWLQLYVSLHALSALLFIFYHLTSSERPMLKSELERV